jgi:hypothetical protein
MSCTSASGAKASTKYRGDIYESPTERIFMQALCA